MTFSSCLLYRYFLGCANFFFYGESITDYFNGNPNPQVDDASEVSVIPNNYCYLPFPCTVKFSDRERELEMPSGIACYMHIYPNEPSTFSFNMYIYLFIYLLFICLFYLRKMRLFGNQIRVLFE